MFSAPPPATPIAPLCRKRLRAAFETARTDLLATRSPDGAHWIGELSTSALSTATAVSALSLVAEGDVDRPLIAAGVRWLVAHQSEDGGWGDTDRSVSNIATTMLVQAAIKLAGVAAEYTDAMERATRYVESRGGVIGLRRRYGKDHTFSVPILSNCALAGMFEWDQVLALPFELATWPQSLYRFLRMPVVSYAIPALVAIGQLRFFRRPPRNRLWRWYRQRCVEPSLGVLERMQPASGGYLEAIPLTSFVVMSLAGTGRTQLPVVRKGVEFLRRSALADGSWQIDVNLATWGTTLSWLALATEGAGWLSRWMQSDSERRCESLDWVLSCQHRDRHPFTGAAPGGWGWTDLSGAVPDADDTPGALLALAAWRREALDRPDELGRIDEAARMGVDWLLGLQNDDGGWPTFCRGWGRLPFDRSGADLTAHALRALHAWEASDVLSSFARQRLPKAIRGGWNYLGNRQRPDGAWIPLWFGNQHDACEENPIYGTAKVVIAYCETGRTSDSRAQKGLKWLSDRILEAPDGLGSVEETALAVEALAAEAMAANRLTGAHSTRLRQALNQGLDWLIRAVETKGHLQAAPIGLYFAKLWYYEKLYPLVFSVAALGRALGVIESEGDDDESPSPPNFPPASN